MLTPRSRMKDGDNALRSSGSLGRLTRCWAAGWSSFTRWTDTVPVERRSAAQAKASIWAELLSTSSPDTKVLLRYGKSNGWLDGQPAVITRASAAGRLRMSEQCSTMRR